MNLQPFYNYLSFWFFGWYLLYKFKFTKINPFIAYLIIYIFFAILLTQKPNKLNLYNITENYDTLLLFILIFIIIDIYPMFRLNPIINYKSILLFLLIITIYLLFMYYNNYNLSNIITIYNYLSLKKISKYKLNKFINILSGINL